MAKKGFWERKTSCLVFFGVLLLCIVFVGCATATAVPPGATPEQIEQVNAANLKAIATNTATQTGITIASIILSFLSAILVAL